jgi:hypothetical protein
LPFPDFLLGAGCAFAVLLIAFTVVLDGVEGFVPEVFDGALLWLLGTILFEAPLPFFCAMVAKIGFFGAPVTLAVISLGSSGVGE